MAADRLSVLETFQNNGVKLFLVLQGLDSAVFPGLDHCYVPPKHALVVELLDYPLNKSSEEIAFSELDDSDGPSSRLWIGQPQMHGHCFLQPLHDASFPSVCLPPADRYVMGTAMPFLP